MAAIDSESRQGQITTLDQSPPVYEELGASGIDVGETQKGLEDWWNGKKLRCFPRDPITLSDDDWGVQSPPHHSI